MSKQAKKQTNAAKTTQTISCRTKVKKVRIRLVVAENARELNYLAAGLPVPTDG